MFRSLRTLGGTLAQAKAILYLVGSVKPSTAEKLRGLRVSTKIVSTLEPRCPRANKIHVLDCSDDFDYLVALDNDVVIARDFSAFVDGRSVRARPAGKDPLTPELWRALFEYAGVPLPAARVLTCNLQETIPYFNSGVLIVPRAHVIPLGQAWRTLLPVVLDACRVFPGIAAHGSHTGQYAFALSLAASGIPYCALPLEMNYQSHVEMHAAISPVSPKPYIMHHLHHLECDGTLPRSSCENVNPAIESWNSAMRQEGTSKGTQPKCGGR